MRRLHMEDYLRGVLELPGPPIEFVVDSPNIVTFDSEPPGLEATAAGEIDAFLCSEPVGREQIDDGAPLRMLEEPALRELQDRLRRQVVRTERDRVCRYA